MTQGLNLSKYETIPAAILAGGKSLRFGSDKKFYKIEGRTLIEIACDKVKKFSKKYIVLDSKEKLLVSCPGFILIEDLIPYKGPLFAVYSALNQTEEEKCIFIPVDMPFLSEKIFDLILKESDFYEIIYFNVKGKVYPIPGLYSKGIIPQVENLLEKKVFSFRSFLERFDNKKEINLVEFKDFNLEWSFLNINRVSDLDGASG